MKGLNNNDFRNNMSADIFGHQIDDVFTKIGDAADEASGNDSKVGHKIGSFLDALTEDINIKIGKKEK